MFLDADDILHETYIDKAINVLINQLTINIVYDYTAWTKGAIPSPIDQCKFFLILCIQHASALERIVKILYIFSYA